MARVRKYLHLRWAIRYAGNAVRGEDMGLRPHECNHRMCQAHMAKCL